jgi:drug/metabolite transporter (DMT)-like permease
MSGAGEAIIAGPLLGQVLAVLSAACFAFANNFISLTRRSGGDKGVLFSVLVTMVMSGLIWITFEFPTGIASASAATLQAIGWFALSGVCAMVFGRSLVFESIRRLGVTRSTAVKRLNPFFSVMLAALLLNEQVSGADVVGMVAIAAAFALMIRESFTHGRVSTGGAPPATYYLFGVFGALAYAFAYIARKLGLNLIDTPALGTFVSAITGFALFVLIALVSERYRSYFRNLFNDLDRWILGSAIMVSFGQILLFAALAYERVSTVVMIASLEIFISIFLSVMIFRTERLPGPAVIVAAVLATAGVLLVAER